MKRRLFYMTKLYDYTSEEEAKKDIEKMRKKGYFVKRQANGQYIYKNNTEIYPYSVEYIKEG